MTVAETRSLPIAQKLQIMEAIWEDLRERFESEEVSPQVRQLLDQRRAEVERGESELLDWDEIKSTLGRK